MNTVYITGIICATIIALAWMIYDIRRRRVEAMDRLNKMRSQSKRIEKETVIEVPVYSRSGQPEPQPEHKRKRGSIKGYYVGPDGTVLTEERKGGAANEA